MDGERRVAGVHAAAVDVVERCRRVVGEDPAAGSRDVGRSAGAARPPAAGGHDGEHEDGDEARSEHADTLPQTAVSKSPVSDARTTAWTRSRRSSFWRMCVLCVLTVVSLM